VNQELIGSFVVRTLPFVLSVDVRVGIPTAVIKLDEADAAFDEASGEEAEAGRS
jgi:hypothetical protein